MLEDSDRIDLTRISSDGDATLYLFDAGVTRDPDARLAFLNKKLAGYSHAASHRFVEHDRHVTIRSYAIKVVYAVPPTTDMLAIQEVMYVRDEMPATIPVTFEYLANPYPDQSEVPISTGVRSAQNWAGEPVLELRHLHRFFGKLKAVNDVSFKAYPGQVLGYIGPNGAGKTTSMRIIATLDTPTAGDAFVCGYSVIDDPDKVRRMLGFMPDAFGKYHNMNVVEYLDFFSRAYGLRGQKRRDSLENVLVFTELRKLAEKPIISLSKGQSQRLALGRCLIHDPQVLILDEPAAGLDPRARIELRELIRLMATQMKKTILISSHILTELGEICDSAAIIEAGQMLAFGTIEELAQQQRVVQGQTGLKTLSIKLLADENPKHNPAALERWLVEQPFVVHVQVAGMDIAFDFDGDQVAQHRLLKDLISHGFPIIEFQGKTETLEDAFMSITKGVMQ